METIKERALEIAEEMGIIWREGNTDEGGIIEQEAIDFATKLIAAWQEQQKPMAHGDTLVAENSRWISAYQLKLAPPPAVPEDYFADACRLAMELECLLLACTDTAAYSKWWESANEALDQHRERIEQMRKEQE